MTERAAAATLGDWTPELIGVLRALVDAAGMPEASRNEAYAKLEAAAQEVEAKTPTTQGLPTAW
ncbi:MAG: hypothetical protein ACYDAY_12065 [Candidatus Dormibacteria bacterium]